MDATQQSQASKVEVRVEDLIDGRTIQFPVTDKTGVLLLSENSVVTARFRELLKARGISSVLLDPKDAASTTIADVTTAESDLSFDQELQGKLAGIQGHLSPKEQVVFHGCKPYDPVTTEQMSRRHDATVNAIDGMLAKAIQGLRSSADPISGMAGRSLADLAADCEVCFSTAISLQNDNELAHHCLQMAVLGMAIGIEMELDAESIHQIGICGLVHDWGMAKVSKEIRNAERKLTRTEYIEVQKHCVHTQGLLELLEDLPVVIQQVSYQIHERPNGKGYPRGRTLEDIHPFARILNVADCYAAMTSQRPYRNPVMPYHAMECLLRQSKDAFVDPDAVRALLRALSLFPIGSLVLLSDGAVGRVIRRNPQSYAAPIVQRIQGANGTRYESDSPDLLVDLAEAEIKVVKALPNPRRNEIALEGEELEFQSKR